MKRPVDMLGLILLIAGIPHAIWMVLCYAWYLLSVAYLLTIGRVVLHIQAERNYQRAVRAREVYRMGRRERKG